MNLLGLSVFALGGASDSSEEAAPSSRAPMPKLPRWPSTPNRAWKRSKVGGQAFAFNIADTLAAGSG